MVTGGDGVGVRFDFGVSVIIVVLLLDLVLVLVLVVVVVVVVGVGVGVAVLVVPGSCPSCFPTTNTWGSKQTRLQRGRWQRLRTSSQRSRRGWLPPGP